ncbi:MAG: hypothetical protein U5L96_12880 [Owenweeksia sp.]|nr:hypothetical protein [Owenweeksia sp.]
MRNFLIILFAFLISSDDGLWAQTENYELAGTLKTDGNLLVPIKINIEINSDGTVTGSSVTNFYSEDKTESKITGQVDFKNQVLSFAEVQNISTSSDANDDEFCYIRVERLPWKQSKSKTIFNGSFSGHYPDSSSCAQGEIYLVSMDLLKNFVDENKMLSGLKDSLKHHYQNLESQEKSAEENTKVDLKAPLLNETEAFLNWNSADIRIHIWDSYEEDNDRFDIYINDSLFHNSVVATAHKKLYRFNFTGNACTIKIVAENEGKRPPNTFQAQLIDSAEVHTFETKLKKDEFVKLTFVRPRP